MDSSWHLSSQTADHISWTTFRPFTHPSYLSGFDASRYGNPFSHLSYTDIVSLTMCAQSGPGGNYLGTTYDSISQEDFVAYILQLYPDFETYPSHVQADILARATRPSDIYSPPPSISSTFAEDFNVPPGQGVIGAPPDGGIDYRQGDIRPRTTSPWHGDGSQGLHVNHVVPHGVGRRGSSYTPRWCERTRTMFETAEAHLEFHRSCVPIPEEVMRAHALTIEGGRVACLWECCPARSSFFRYYEARRHMESNHGPKLYACTVPGCGKSFSRPDSLVRHTRDEHD